MAGSGEEAIPIVHVWGELQSHTSKNNQYTFIGTPYEMGNAHGSLMMNEARGLINDVWSYMESQVVRKYLTITTPLAGMVIDNM